MQLNGTFDVKLGKSFLDPDAATFMTMRCDFMPASVDRSQPGSIRVDEGKEVVVNLPNVASIGPGSTCFRGSARPVQKECILIYNKRTGELTLERVAHAVQLKKTREERKPTPCLVNTASTSNSETQSDSVRRPLVAGDMGAGRDKAGPTTSPPKRKLTGNTAPQLSPPSLSPTRRLKQGPSAVAAVVVEASVPVRAVTATQATES
ncbi:chromatin modification- protein VID21 [Clonorchis sinensis]|uniref:Chromatin modification- protein VID21 n=1 Tax=Clonorchis sinensis TaxID=79923 RepID=A0A419PZD5_CLOSI|nr:chromatin modification- protein VID21 [Clonorchis sinensis]